MPTVTLSLGARASFVWPPANAGQPGQPIPAMPSEQTPERSDPTGDPRIEAAYHKSSWRLIPFLGLCYLVAYLDRVNVGFAKLQMNGALGFSDTVYGLGAGIFFLGYFLFEVPSNLLLHRLGARVWIARIMVSWGLVSMGTTWVGSETGFYFMRFLLGIAEAGFFPGIVLYLTYWYPAHRRGQITALFMSAVALSGVVGGPISGWILQAMDRALGLAGWQWLFLLEGLPAVASESWSTSICRTGSARLPG
jgi:MFS family permease